MMCEGFMPRNISSDTTAELITVSEIMLVLISWHTGLVCSFVKESSKPPGCRPEGQERDDRRIPSHLLCGKSH